jgi:DNA-directed RNA polymerase subunit beta'
LNDFDSFKNLQINLASEGKIREQSHGEVKKPETINYRTLKPEKGGLFCEQIFGPVKDYECHCGKYRRIRYRGIVCDRCGVELTSAKVRRERRGHIDLAVPVSHIWYFKGVPSRMGLLLDMSPRSLEKILYFVAYVVINPGKTSLTKKQILTEKEYRECFEKYEDKFEAGMGAEAILKLLKEVDLAALSVELREELVESKGQKRIRLTKRLEIVEAFRFSENKPEWMILTVLTVIPPELRPMVQLDGGRFATSDLNDLYRRVINRNNRLKRLLSLGAPEIIVKNEKRMLQESVDALIDNGRRGKPVVGANNRPLKSLSDMLKGKQGRFRQNLLGKRVDYSGRSVIVVGPELKMYQCGLPKEMAIELFKPFIMRKLVNEGFSQNIKSAKRMVERLRPEVWDVLDDVISEHPVLLNRAPTLHKLGIQAFEPVLVEGRALKLHPLVCRAYNADFDGDQMAIHVPLSVEAQAEARFLMLSSNNLLKPQNGKSVASPTKDIVLGIYYLTMEVENEKGANKMFSSSYEAILAYENDFVGIHAPIYVKFEKIINNELKSEIIKSTVGRVIFNEQVPQNLGFVDRSVTENVMKLEINFKVDSKILGKIVDNSIRIYGTTETSMLLDKIKQLGFKYSTQSASTVSVSDMVVPDEKKYFLSEADKKVELILDQYNRGLLNDEERYGFVIEVWRDATNEITNILIEKLNDTNPIFLMFNSGARGSINQIRQLVGIRGLMSNTLGRTVEIPIKANFREGLNVFEFFISSHGARKGSADTAIRTADSGYLTRRLVDVSQDVIIKEIDCGTNEGIIICDIKDGKEIIEPFIDRLSGRILIKEIIDPKTGVALAEAGKLIDDLLAEKIVASGVTEAYVRSVLKCRSKLGICAKCYGNNLTTGKLVCIGEAVGIVAAQSIGEPGTQLTMQTFHSGGIAAVAGEDITQGLPRVEELFETRKPKGLAIVSEINGKIKISGSRKKREISVADEENGQTVSYSVPYGSTLRVSNEEFVNIGDKLTEGSINPHDLLRIKNSEAVQNYLVQEVQRVYRLQGVDINDKHIEIIIRQMMKKVRVDNPGDTILISGSVIDSMVIEEMNEEMRRKNLKEAEFSEVLMGVTKASLATESFLSAASFQETTKVLTDAAIKGKIDPLFGLKENVIIGKLIPSGTGLSIYNDIEVFPNKDVDEKTNEELECFYINSSNF